jgi:hypothetical protein
MPAPVNQESLAMNPHETEQPVHDVPQGDAAAGPGATLPSNEVGQSSAAPSVTFQANTYDLVALGSLASGALVLFSCLTCNMGFYCLPLLPLALGIVGLVGARQAVQAERTRLWSWLGIAAGAIILLLFLLAILLYIGFIAWAVITQPS